MFEAVRRALTRVRERARNASDAFTDSPLSWKIREETIADILSELELGLISADVALPVAERIRESVSEHLLGKRVRLGTDIDGLIIDAERRAISSILKGCAGDFDASLKRILEGERPAVIMFVGVNGSGKTTTIAKVAYRLRKMGMTCVLAAADTFRAGAIEQISIHAGNLGIRVVKQGPRADPAAVAYDAVEHARARRVDVVLIDTAGRMQTNVNLMGEMKKIKRVVEPHMVVFVGDALTGNDAVEQAITFENEVGLDGVVLCKVDADAKGGCALSIAATLNKPIYFLGVGQEYRNLAKFNPDWMVRRIFSA